MSLMTICDHKMMFTKIKVEHPDSAYPILKHCMILYSHSTNVQCEKHFNKIQSSIRFAIENAFRLLTAKSILMICCDKTLTIHNMKNPQYMDLLVLIRWMVLNWTKMI
ncbi:hypothetical protein PHYBLDRAFT_58426 [Phycomyces blakesleeanus NRRL 1555(-)]|uniref:Uncharacterized protein n=1 Tax=Phycomyces blakesleeanus (strain ATCC 8743b / DSM 1359 / FGSC 10004 / NBRC 33097 / NRRL 1555) TaxID=763407 RepID=A0A162YAC6_PHYB8|nr:hypothetical protein PHYBLDRAFT_58426 [Phycomyces blakesleeanus NRRL 1555(-)]OAD79375.1 hypothetical protein PHYBLDRAFT_58426 [Phycomyces blakesleeanus NRRL 1555(-)]|eukprot:XP_018297415.1 hypothetical protein PHYBLDRAFT_58426 [Phycomyces blakesleeanus NRRL 1555(-)]